MNNETDKRVQYYMHNEISGEMFCTIFPNLSKRLVKLTNLWECHNGFRFKTGLNEDTIPFDPTDECKKGGIYFTDIGNIARWLEYSNEIMKYCRTVTLPSDCRVYIEDGKFKADKMILGERVDISDLPYWSDNNYCLNAVRKDIKSLIYIRDINHDIQIEAVRNNRDAIRYLFVKKINISKEIKIEVVKRHPLAILCLLDYQIDIPKEVQLEAVKHNWDVIGFLLQHKINVSDEVRLAAGFNAKQINVE
jgi:hypothetical protein